MLLHLHVKNLALIDEVEVDFTSGLNILTGETGAGKSVLLGAVNLALGARAEKDIIREGAEFALAELTFQLENENQVEYFKKLDFDVEDDCVILQRKIYPSRNVYKLNGESVTVSTLKEISPVLLDVYGQHDYQSLLNPNKHLGILDSFLDEKGEKLLDEVSKQYQIYLELKKKMNEPLMDQAQRTKELDFARFEVNEIESAMLKENEEEELFEFLRRSENAEKIMSGLCEVQRLLCNQNGNAEELLDRSCSELSAVSSFDETIMDYSERANEISSLLSELNREIRDYCDSLEFNPTELDAARNRYDEINRLEMKYGKTIPDVLNYLLERKQFIEGLESAESDREALKHEFEKAEEKLKDSCEKLAKSRKKEAEKLAAEITNALKDLNFLQACFEIDIEETEEYSVRGNNKVSFMISTNPGEKLKPLSQVASGGELSRIMLAIKTVSAKRDDINTLIFDEIDSGISGKTAWKVSEMLGSLGSNHQIICITHLPQIAAMSDQHFEISKNETDGKTKTEIKPLDEKMACMEIGRLLGGENLTDNVLNNAKELREQALNFKKNLK